MVLIGGLVCGCNVVDVLPSAVFRALLAFNLLAFGFAIGIETAFSTRVVDSTMSCVALQSGVLSVLEHTTQSHSLSFLSVAVLKSHRQPALDFVWIRCPSACQSPTEHLRSCDRLNCCVGHALYVVSDSRACFSHCLSLCRCGYWIFSVCRSGCPCKTSGD